MTTLLLANVGLRDVMLDGQKIEPAREQGERILAELETHSARLSLPLITPPVEQSLRQGSQLRVVLFATNQPEWAPPEHRARDTVHFGKIAAALLETRWSRRGLEKVWCESIDGNPSLYDDMVVAFRRQLGSNRRWMREVECCYVCPVGGTPAANLGLVLAAVARFGERCRVLYLPEGESRPRELDLSRQLRQGVARDMAAASLQHYDFEAAAALLEKADAPEWMERFARYAAQRYHFDFEAASSQLEAARRASMEKPDARNHCERTHHELSALMDRQPEARIRELYHNGSMAWGRHEYTAFLGRVFRFQEALYRLMVEELFPGLSTEVDSKESQQRWCDYVESKPGLHQFLNAQQTDGRHLDYRGANRTVFAAMIRYGWEGGENFAAPERLGQMKAACRLLEGLDCLSGLRNKSIIAHGFEGVSEQSVVRRYQQRDGRENPLTDMAGALESLGIAVGESPFDLAAGLLRGEIERL